MSKSNNIKIGALIKIQQPEGFKFSSCILNKSTWTFLDDETIGLVLSDEPYLIENINGLLEECCVVLINEQKYIVPTIICKKLAG